MHDSNNDSPIYRDVSGDGDEFRRAIKHSCVGLKPGGALAFHPEHAKWAEFYSGVFSEKIAPHFTTAYTAAGAGETKRLIELDETFANTLDGIVRGRLLAEAGTVFEARAGAGGMRLLDRLSKHPDGCTFTTAFAAHAASFNIPLLHATVAYLAVEWRAGNSAAGLKLENSREWDKVFTAELLTSPEPVRQVLARSMRGWADVA